MVISCFRHILINFSPYQMRDNFWFFCCVCVFTHRDEDLEHIWLNISIYLIFSAISDSFFVFSVDDLLFMNVCFTY